MTLWPFRFRSGAWLLLALFLGGCGHVALFNLAKPASPAPAPAAAPSKPVCPGNLSADLETEPQLPAGAGFPAPTTEAEAAAVALYGTWLHAFAVYARHGWARAGEGRDYCTTPR